ncbi:hypothetical protein [Aliihoeflea sp. 40Bstr573]|uniref:hypothetical protein n=1 Tax=Aliihoeflea sp. 40Bstr573 TaxID=2696467 RepID=UPI002095051A|nr:hypothetical protein [Aliihoeflea sp. 40Bstr573]MCO6389143.1 hypothetical protein [Aliihoeflea sp. 40Bstr573]
MPQPPVFPSPFHPVPRARAGAITHALKETRMARHKRRRRKPPKEIPPLPVLYHARQPYQTDAQYAVTRQWDEDRAQIDAVLQSMFRHAATWLGLMASCKWSVCRRARRCVGPLRPTDALAHTGRIFPPCCDTPARAEEVRMLNHVTNPGKWRDDVPWR